MKIRRVSFILLIATFLVLIRLVVNQGLDAEFQSVLAQEFQTTPIPDSESPHEDTSKCLGCHSDPSMVGRFQDRTTISLYVDPEVHEGAIRHLMRCPICHQSQRTYPHENSRQASCSVCHWEKTNDTKPEQLVYNLYYPDKRAMSLQVTDSCKKCHKEKYAEMADSAHLEIMSNGNRYAPVCVDCHSSHEIAYGMLTREVVAKICSECHLAVYTSYQSSVHGVALEQEANPDVPTCGDCHGIHSLLGPNNVDFRADSIVTCGNCHSDPKRMEKYDISTDVLRTYLEDFHGRTVEFFRKTEETQITKATCYDCHGIHNIRSPEDDASTVYPDNLQHTCQQCHPEADITFPQAWLSHYAPSWEKTPVLFGVNLFYKILIPTVIGGFGIYILLDARRRIFHAVKARRKK
jgi:predicted CXXCH cytochrome family protein